MGTGDKELSGGVASEIMSSAENDINARMGDHMSDNIDDTFCADYTDSITSTNSQKPLLSSSKKHVDVLVKSVNKNILVGDSLWDLKEEDDEMLERHSIISGLLEKPAFMKAISCESLRSNLLTQACKSALMLSVDKSGTNLNSQPKKQMIANLEHRKIERQNVLKRMGRNLSQLKDVILLSIGTMIAYSAFLSVRNLQSSLNTSSGLGLISLAVGYSMYIPGSILAPFFMKVLRPKRAIIVALSFQAVYVFMNMYPSFYTVLPACMLIGFGNALFWVSVSTYLVFSAKACAESTKKVLEFVVTRFYGTFFLIYQLNNVPGNILSSALLFDVSDQEGNSTPDSVRSDIFFSNSSFNESHSHTISALEPSVLCGASYSYSASSNTTNTPVDEHQRFILIGSLGAIEVLGLLTILLFVKPVKTYKAKVQLKVIKQEVVHAVGMFKDKRYCLLTPLLIYSGLQISFMNGDMIKAFITCTLGIKMVGYLAMGYGLASSLSSYLSGILNKRIGRQVQVLAGFSINLAALVFMLIWQPASDSSLIPYVLLFCIWGLADGIWNAQLNGLLMVVFGDKIESAQACFRLLQGLGASMAYGYAQVLVMSTKIYITGALALIGFLGYVVMEIGMRRERKTSEKEIDV